MLQEAGEETGPLAEVEAWQERAKRLNGIHAQLGSPDIVRVGKVLEAAQSTYFSAFTRYTVWGQAMHIGDAGCSVVFQA